MNVMKSTFRVLFYLRKNEVNKSGNSSIMVRITVNGEQVQFSSKLQIKPGSQIRLEKRSKFPIFIENREFLFYYFR